MTKVIITVGIPASGKTTWANEYVKTHPNTVISCRDDIRSHHNFPYGIPAVENHVTAIQHIQIMTALVKDKDVIVADTNIVDRFRRELIEFCISLGAVVRVRFLPVDLETALDRDSRREAPVGYDVIKRYFDAYQRMDCIVDSILTETAPSDTMK